tara:strand:- start:1454 stop:2719 length:1266 start_codon:yes stop_codon:yes gene_type:complete
MSNLVRRLSVFFLLAVFLQNRCQSAPPEGTVRDDLPVHIFNPETFPPTPITVKRTALGIPNDYKPWIAQLPNGTLLLVAFCFGPVDGVEGYMERAVFWRSTNGGKSWAAREERQDVHGREFSLNVLHDGTILMPCHLLALDLSNRAKYTLSKLFRSTDLGATWSEIQIGPEGFPPGANTATDWTTVQYRDRKNPGRWITRFGVSIQHGGEDAGKAVGFWKSTDSGATWDRTFHPDTDGWVDVDGFFSQSTTYRSSKGTLLHPVRVDRTGPHWHIAGTPEKLKEERGDNGDRMMLWKSTDNGDSWRRHGMDGRFGHYGEMYPRFLRLQDGGLLLTFTVRSNSTDGYSLGLRAIISNDDGKSWNFRQDRLVLSSVNYGASGGGFGNTVQLMDGTLVSCYSYRGKDGMTHVEAMRWSLPVQSSK